MSSMVVWANLFYMRKTRQVLPTLTNVPGKNIMLRTHLRQQLSKCIARILTRDSYCDSWRMLQRQRLTQTG
jgi:hypothetical protein